MALTDRNIKIVIYLLARIHAIQTHMSVDSIMQEVDIAFPASKIRVKKVKGFVPPTLEELKEYMQKEKHTHYDPQEFIDFYSSKGWMVGKNKMTSWKAAAGRWERSNKSNYGKSGTDNRQAGKGDYYGEESLF